MPPPDPSFFGLSLGTWLGILGILIGVATSYYFYRRSRVRNTLEYAVKDPEVISTDTNYPGLSIVARYPDRTGVDGTTGPIVSAPIIYRYIVVNTGNLPIDKSDFKQPIQVSPRAEEDSAKILGVSITSVSTNGIHETGDVIRNDVTGLWQITPELMNPGDWIRLSVLTDNLRDCPLVQSWRKGESRAMQLTRDPSGEELIRRNVVSLWFPAIWGGMLMLFGFGMASSATNIGSRGELVAGIVFGIAGVGWLLFSISLFIRRAKAIKRATRGTVPIWDYLRTAPQEVRHGARQEPRRGRL